MSNKIERTGVITEILGSARFRVLLEEAEIYPILNNKSIICNICGKMRQKRIKIVKGDKVKVSIIISSNSIEDLKGTITFRLDY
jgi:translation initiation factor IF-1